MENVKGAFNYYNAYCTHLLFNIIKHIQTTREAKMAAVDGENKKNRLESLKAPFSRLKEKRSLKKQASNNLNDTSSTSTSNSAAKTNKTKPRVTTFDQMSRENAGPILCVCNA